MATNFPTSLDSLTNPTASDKLNSGTVPHATQHATLNDAVEALEAKVGVDGSAVTTSHDYLIDKQSVVPYADSSARTTAVPSPVEGQMSYLEDTNSVEVYDGSAWAAVAGGKILQVVRATDTTTRSTTSTSYVDANISVTITPTSATSNILLIWSLYASASSNRGVYILTDSSNVAIEGAEATNVGYLGANAIYNAVTLVGYDSPATTSATTYKGRFSSPSGVTVYCMNASTTGQLFALEISA
jgi:hypothetical protein